MGAGVFIFHVFKIFLFPQLIQQDQIPDHIPAVLEAGITGMGIQQLLPVVLAGKFLTLIAVVELFLLVAADPQFAAPFGFPFLPFTLDLGGATQAGFIVGRAGSAVDPAGGEFREGEMGGHVRIIKQIENGGGGMVDKTEDGIGVAAIQDRGRKIEGREVHCLSLRARSEATDAPICIRLFRLLCFPPNGSIS